MYEDVENLAVFESIIKSKSVLSRHQDVVVSISGGSDSDLVIDLIEKVRGEKRISYVWYDTGLEYQATKDHLDFLEEKYGVEIQRVKAKKPIPFTCKHYGQPFISKMVSEYILRLQYNNFQWEDEPYDQLIQKYPHCSIALKWWCNAFAPNGNKESRFNISHNRYLKEFMVENPPDFKISNKCCHYAKKAVVKEFMKKIGGADLNIYGVRKAEGGARSAAYKNCFTAHVDDADEYRPIFYYTDEDKEYYEDYFSITHSDCYKKYGLKRTGCAGCPFGLDFETELKIIQEYEPHLYTACNSIFGESYEYTRKYRKFCEQKRAEKNKT